MASKKIMLTTNILWTFTNFRIPLAKRLIDEGYEMVCVAAYEEEFSDSCLEQIEASGTKFVPIHLTRRSTGALDNLSTFRQLNRAIGAERPDLIMHFTIKMNIYGSLIARWRGIPFINTVNGLGSGIISGGVSERLIRQLYWCAFGRSRRVFFQNPDDRSYFVGNRLVRESKTAYVPGSGIELDRFQPREAPPSDKTRVLMISRLLRDKGILEYIEACRHFTRGGAPVEFRIAGVIDQDNPTALPESDLRAWEAEGIVRHIGKTDDIQSFIADADLIVLPSYREGLSKVLLEAAAMERPIVTSDAPGCRDVVDDGETGFLCPARSGPGLIAALEKFFALDAPARRAMGQAARRKVASEFDIEIVNQMYVDTIREILGE